MLLCLRTESSLIKMAKPGISMSAVLKEYRIHNTQTAILCGMNAVTKATHFTMESYHFKEEYIIIKNFIHNHIELRSAVKRKSQKRWDQIEASMLPVWIRLALLLTFTGPNYYMCHYSWNQFIRHCNGFIQWISNIPMRRNESSIFDVWFFPE